MGSSSGFCLASPDNSTNVGVPEGGGARGSKSSVTWRSLPVSCARATASSCSASGGMVHRTSWVISARCPLHWRNSPVYGPSTSAINAPTRPAPRGHMLSSGASLGSMVRSPTLASGFKYVKL